MITVDIIHNGVQIAYTQEVESFSWQITNNEGTSFVASVPTLTGMITIASVSDFLTQLEKGDIVKITSEGQDSLTLILRIIEAVVLRDKGKTEIACSGEFFNQPSNIYGSVVVAENQWATTQQLYGLQGVEMHEPNKGFIANVRKKEDLIMGVAWAANTRRVVSPTPFTTADTNFKSGGLGIFKEDSDPPANSVTPLYKVDADQIVSYEVGAPQPPVTHIQTTGLGDLEATPQVPKMTLAKYSSGGAGTVQIAANVKAYYVEETGLAAVYALQEKPSGAIERQSLTWTDGFVNVWYGSQRKSIIGIVEEGYVEITNTSPTVISVINRNSGEVLASFTLEGQDAQQDLYDADGYDSRTRFKPYKTTKFSRMPSSYPSVDNMDEYWVVWFRHATKEGEIALLYCPKNTGVKGDIWSVGAVAKDYYFGDVCKIEPIQGLKGYGLKCILHTRMLSNSGRAYMAARVYTLYQKTDAYQLQSAFEYAFDFCPYDLGLSKVELQYGETGYTFLDFLATKKVASDNFKDHILWRFDIVKIDEGTETTYPTYVAMSKGTGDATLHWSHNEEVIIGSDALWYRDRVNVVARWVLTGKEIAPQYNDTDIVLIRNDGKWYSGTFSMSESLNIVVEQRGDIYEWAKVSSMYAFLARGVIFCVSYKGERYWEVFLQSGVMPFLSRGCGSPMLSEQVAQGEKNEVLLDFKVGALQQDDLDNLDEEQGRIELEVTEFYVQDNSTKNWILKDVQDLHNTAIGSYILVQLSPDDQERRKVKVTGCIITYTGLARLKIRGLLVK